MNPTHTQIGDYEIQSELGRGGMGVVYKAVHRGTGTAVAIKLLINPNHELKAKSLIEEAVTGGKVDHPNCLKIYEILEYGPNKSPAIISEYVEGLNARQFLDLPLFQEASFVFSPLSASLIFEQMLRGLRAAHIAGLVHQDIKPENYLIRQDVIEAIQGCVGEAGELDHDEMDELLLGLRDESWVKLSDWGLSIYKERERSMEKSLSISLSRIPEEKRGGTLVYMPPEQIDGVGISRRTDIFALGLVFYELLTGRAAIHARSSAEGLSQDALDSAQNFLIQMVTSSAVAAIDGRKDKALKELRWIPQIAEMLTAMTMRQKADRIQSKELSEDLEDLIEELLEPPRPFPKAFLFGALVIFALPFILWHVLFRLFPPAPQPQPSKKDNPVQKRELSLTEQQAQFLKQGLKGNQEALGKVMGLSLADCETLAQSKGRLLNLASLKTLLPEKAKALARFRGDELILTGLTSLDPESARQLSLFFGKSLVLKTEKPLTQAVQKELFRFSGELLDLSRQKDIDADKEVLFSRFSGRLLLRKKYADLLAFAKDINAQYIPKSEQALMQKVNSGALEDIPLLKTVSPALARFFVKTPSLRGKKLELKSVEDLSPECAGILSRFPGPALAFEGLFTLSEDAARALSRVQGALTVQTSDKLPASVLSELIPYAGPQFVFNSGQTLTLEHTEVLARFKTKDLRFIMVRAASPTSLRALAEFQGTTLGYTPPFSPPAEEIAALSGYKGTLYLSVYGRLKPGQVQALKRLECKGLGLMGVTNPSPAQVRELCQWRGEELSFYSLESLSVESAQELVRFPGRSLSILNSEIPSPIKKILGTFPREVKFK